MSYGCNDSEDIDDFVTGGVGASEGSERSKAQRPIYGKEGFSGVWWKMRWYLSLYSRAFVCRASVCWKCLRSSGAWGFGRRAEDVWAQW